MTDAEGGSGLAGGETGEWGRRGDGNTDTRVTALLRSGAAVERETGALGGWAKRMSEDSE